MTQKKIIPAKGLFFLIISVVLLISCNHNNSMKQSNSKDLLTFIKVIDADTFYSSWSKQNTLICHEISDPDMLHPTNGVSADRLLIFGLIHRFLIAMDVQNLTVRPDLVKSLPEISKNELEYTYDLKDGIKWDDGSSLTTDDVIFTIKANKCPLTDNTAFRVFMNNVKDVVKVAGSKTKFTIVMKKKYIHNLIFLTDFPVIQRTFFDPSNILSKYSLKQFDDSTFIKKAHKDIDAWATEFNDVKYGRDPDKISGLGPYRLESWESEQSMVLVKKKNYKKNNAEDSSVYANAFPDKIIFRLNRDQNSLALEFKAQTYDLSTFFSTRNLIDLQKDVSFSRNYHTGFVPTYNYSYLAMNMKPDGIKHKSLFTDKRVRRAIACLTPVDDIIAMVDKGKSKRIVGPVSPLKKDFNSDLTPIPLDVKKARALLDSAGWKDTDGDNILDKIIDGEKVKFEFDLIYYNTAPDWKDMALLIQESLYKAGIKVVPTALEPDAAINKVTNHDFDAFLGVWGGNSLPEDFTQLWHTSSWVSKGSNYTGFGNAASDALIDSIKYMVSDVERARLVKRFQKMVYDDQPYVFIKSGVRKVAIHKRFGNANMYYEKPGVIFNNLRLLYGVFGVAYKNVVTP